MMLALKNIEHRFDERFALREIDLEVDQGKVQAIVGPSGSGKSTLLRIVAGLTSPTAGGIFIDGLEVTRTPTESRGIVLVFQDSLLFPRMNVLENVAFPMRARGEGKAAAQERARRLLERVQLGGLAERAPSSLSGGER